MRTLDGEERRLLDTDIVITNGKDPIALGGVMGGDFSEVTEQTRHVVVEGAIRSCIYSTYITPFKFKKRIIESI